MPRAPLGPRNALAGIAAGSLVLLLLAGCGGGGGADPPAIDWQAEAQKRSEQVQQCQDDLDRQRIWTVVAAISLFIVGCVLGTQARRDAGAA
jgi:hypothetical protein